jgi:hypothetical protein
MHEVINAYNILVPKYRGEKDYLFDLDNIKIMTTLQYLEKTVPDYTSLK